MQLNIKDPVFVERARALAKRRGQPVTATLRALLDKEWETEERASDERVAAMEAFTRELQRTVPQELRELTSKEVMDSLYDEDALDGFAH